jgi:AhpC/TSA family/Disulphide bond corrector protein DsbC
LEESRQALETQGVRIAAISYDLQDQLQRFAEQFHIGFPLLSDRDSAVIRAFGIFNTNIAPGLRAHGVPHPVNYLVSSDGIVLRKFFVANYQHRVTGSEIALREFGSAGYAGLAVTLRSGALAIELGLSSAKAFAGQQIGFYAHFALDPGWHVYGTPLPQAYTPLRVSFDDPKIIKQSLELPAAQAMEIAALGEIIPVYSGSFAGAGSLLLKYPLDAGPTALRGQVRFQQCSDTACEPPEALSFELPLTLEPILVPS